MLNRISINIYLPKRIILQQNSIRFFEEFSIFEPTFFCINNRNIKYNNKKLLEIILKEINGKKNTINIYDGEFGTEITDNSICIIIKEKYVCILVYLIKEVYLKKRMK